MFFIATKEEVDIKEKNIERKKRRHRKRKVTLNMVLVPIIVSLFMFFLQLVMSYDEVIYYFNQDKYECKSAVIKEMKTDKIAMLIPKAVIKYEYNGKEYEYEKYFLVEKLYGLDKQQNINIYVNKLAPKYCITKLNFYENKYNIIAMCVIIYCIINFILIITNNIQYIIQWFKLRKRKRHKRELKRAIRKMYKEKKNDIQEEGKNNIKDSTKNNTKKEKENKKTKTIKKS